MTSMNRLCLTVVAVTAMSATALAQTPPADMGDVEVVRTDIPKGA